ncbi:MAG: flavodoxin family protein [Candidatus Hodarchaeales archaeon]|jgi:flavodoxin
MNILIVFDSESGNTKKVVQMLKNKLVNRGYSLTVKHALTATTQHIDDSNLLIIGTPVHGYILFGQKPTKAVRSFISEEVPKNLNQKPVIGFATYLLFPAGVLNHIKRYIDSKNGKLIDLVAKRRSDKADLVSIIENLVLEEYPIQ